MAVARFGTVNLSMDDLRDNGKTKINADAVAARLQQKTSDIHAGWLFDYEGEPILQIICRYVGAPAAGKTHSPHWTEFANYLGEKQVTSVQQKNIENHLTRMETPVWWVLATYAQWDDATLARVIDALQQTKRKDVISLINNAVCALVDYINNDVRSEDNKTGIIRPATVPWVPLVLRPTLLDIRNKVEKVYKIINVTSIPPIVEANGNEPINDPRGQRRNVSFALIVMLTFADDGVAAAKRITKILRSHEPRIGVLSLNEQMHHVWESGREFVDDCLDQVDMIMPILTQGYLEAIKGSSTAQEPDEGFGKDQEWAKYIFTCFTSECIEDDCKNKRVRSIVPKENPQRPRKLDMALRSWCPEAEIQQFIQVFLKKTSKRRSS